MEIALPTFNGLHLLFLKDFYGLKEEA